MRRMGDISLVQRPALASVDGSGVAVLEAVELGRLAVLACLREAGTLLRRRQADNEADGLRLRSLGNIKIDRHARLAVLVDRERRDGPDAAIG